MTFFRHVAATASVISSNAVMHSQVMHSQVLLSHASFGKRAEHVSEQILWFFWFANFQNISKQNYDS